ncbi:hypothetical protein ACE3NQ_08705 [Paenibacillus terreus]|uniref:MORN repeat-containing protein n=1 Tax=Paenibacillus terreus TaxID=1387834 RepID=A0ABV5B5N5_9BACL
MKKSLLIVWGLTLGLSLVAAVLPAQPAKAAEAAAQKQTLELGNAVYYGEVKDGRPHGKGTMKWSNDKSYSGDWVAGQRSGSGKYVSLYEKDGQWCKMVYSGSWKNDRKSGEGQLTEKRVDQQTDEVVYHLIQTGTFAKDQLSAGYTVIHAVADPDFSYNYKDSSMSVQMYGSNDNLVQAWEKGSFLTIDYTKGKVVKKYSIIPEDSAAAQEKNEAALSYLQSILPQMKPHLQTFQRLSEQVPLK